MPDDRSHHYSLGPECLAVGIFALTVTAYISGVVIGSRVASNKFANLLKDIVLN